MHSAKLAGQRLTSIDDSAAPNSWVFYFDGGSRVTVESFWRFVSGNHVSITGDDHAQLFGRTEPRNVASDLLAAVNGRACTNACIANETGDLTLHFGDNGRLEILVNSSGYENWILWDPDGTQLVATGGGRLAETRATVG